MLFLKISDVKSHCYRRQVSATDECYLNTCYLCFLFHALLEKLEIRNLNQREGTWILNFCGWHELENVNFLLKS